MTRSMGVAAALLFPLLAIGSLVGRGGEGDGRANEPVNDRIEEWALRTAESQYGGMWIAGETLVVGFTDDLDSHEVRMRAALGDVDVEIVRTVRSLRTLTSIQRSIQDDRAVIESRGAAVTSIGLRPDRSIVILSVQGNVSAIRDFAERRYPPGSVEVEEGEYASST
jgi:hypothetical protein